MKLSSAFFLVILFSFTQLYPQQFYLKASGGYGIGIAPDVITTSNQIVADGVTSASRGSETFSFGKGVDAAVAAGYHLTSNMSLELEFGYHKSAAVNYASSYSESSFTDNGKFELSAYSFNILPSVVFSTELDAVKPYVKVGPLISFAGVDYIVDEVSIPVQDNTNYNFHLKYEYRGGITFGISSAIGVEYNVGSNVSLMFEINNKNMAYAPEEGELTEYRMNGVSRLEELGDEYKKFSFKESLSANEVQSSGDQIKTEYPFSSLSFLLGVSIEL
jgi:hypothetical protein